jgi:hypothetical protein
MRVQLLAGDVRMRIEEPPPGVEDDRKRVPQPELTGSWPSTKVRPKSASHSSNIGPKSQKTMSSSVITRSGGFSRYGCRVFGPARTIRLCQCLSTPNMPAARSRIALLA